MRVQRKLRPNQARTLSWAAQKKARDMGRGQCVTVLITRGILRVIGADGALIKRGRQSGGLRARAAPRNAARLDNTSALRMIAPPSARRPLQAAGALRRPEILRRSSGRSWRRRCPLRDVPAMQDAATMQPRRPLLSVRW